MFLSATFYFTAGALFDLAARYALSSENEIIYASVTRTAVSYVHFLLMFIFRFLIILFYRKTGWASQPTAGAVEVVTSDELPDDYAERVQKVNAVLMQINGTGLLTIPMAATAAPMIPDPSAILMGTGLPFALNVQSVAEAALNAALGAVTPSVFPGVQAPSAALAVPSIAESQPEATTQVQPTPVETYTVPTRHILIRNMFDKDEETEEGWWNDIREDVAEECSKYGKVEKVVVMQELPGGQAYVSFEDTEMAKQASAALEGRWFDQRQLHVEFVEETAIP